jgi:hypothetical protein
MCELGLDLIKISWSGIYIYCINVVKVFETFLYLF